MSALDTLLDYIAPVIEKVVDAKIAKALENSPGQVSETAVYAGTDSQGKQWVVYDGSDTKAPISWSTVEAKEGDKVSVTIKDGRSIMDANLSDPSAGVNSVADASKKASDAIDNSILAILSSSLAASAASDAERSASAASKSADNAMVASETAWKEAGEALNAASLAYQRADSASSYANSALDSAHAAAANADAAMEEAESAKDSAMQAYYSLSDVEKIVGTVNWIAQHGDYVVTKDTKIENDHVYYILSGGNYALTQDTEINEHKQYYEATVVETEIVYQPVLVPDVSDIENYYERSGMETLVVNDPQESELSTYFVLDISESVQKYIAAHVALAEDGLHILGRPDDYYAILSILGLDIRKPNGRSVALYGEDFRVGELDGVYLLGSSTRLSFRTVAGDIVYFGLDDHGVWNMFMEQAYVRDMIRFGNYAWVKRANGNLTMKYLED